MGKEILRHELIGSHIRIVDAKNKSLIGLYGKIIDETKNTFTIKNHTSKKVIKDQVTLLVKMENETIKIEGNVLVNKSEDRLKK